MAVMRKSHDPSTIRASLRSRASLIAYGWTDKQIRAEVRAKGVRRLHHGWYMPHTLWDELFWEQQHLAHVMAVVDDAREQSPVVVRESAAVTHGLPLYRCLPAKVHVICVGDARASNSADVFRHVGPLDAREIVEIGGIRCTSLARTVVDVARSCDLETAVACADAALRSVAVHQDDPWTYDGDAAERLRREMHVVLGKMPRARGARRARWVIDFADGRAQLPGESVSRLRLVQLGFVVPRIQVPVERPGGRRYYVDIDAGSWLAEFDGAGKYLDPQLRAGASAADVVVSEKRREDWIRAVTGKMTVRLADEHIATAEDCAARLAEYGIQPPRHRPVPDPGPPPR